MHEAVATPLRAWESFYVIVGSSAGALTGLQFVVMTIIAEASASSGRKETISAFGTPNVVHFCAALLFSAILSAPWSSLVYAGVAITACGVLGVGYSVLVLSRTLRQRLYQPVLEDWVWHIILPLVAYAVLFVAGAVLGRGEELGLFVIAAATLLLVFIGIHNAWDTVTYLMLQRSEGGQQTGTRTTGSAIGARQSNEAPGPGPDPNAPPGTPRDTATGAAAARTPEPHQSPEE